MIDDNPFIVSSCHEMFVFSISEFQDPFSIFMVKRQEIRPVLKAVDGEGNDSSSIDARQRHGVLNRLQRTITININKSKSTAHPPIISQADPHMETKPIWEIAKFSQIR